MHAHFQIAESESEKLDLLDRIQALEEHLQELTSPPTASSVGGNRNGAEGTTQNSGELHETLNAKDHYIQQMERQLATVQADSNKAVRFLVFVVDLSL